MTATASALEPGAGAAGPAGTLPFVDQAVTWASIGLAIALAITGLWLLVSARLGRLGRRVTGWSAGRSSQESTPTRRPSRQRFRRERSATAGEEELPPPPPKKRAAIIVNPVGLEAVGALYNRLARACLKHDWDEPLILQTTTSRPGESHARRAADEEVDVVLVLGGDATLRSVAQGLAGTAIPVGILPSGGGTGLARTLGLDTDDLETAMDIALTGQNTHVDVGWVVVNPQADQHPEGQREAENRHAFLIMAGLGVDATVLDGTDPELRTTVGWPAYVPAGVKSMLADRFRARISLDGGPITQIRARTIMIGNGGRLAGGVTLMPDAQIDDGLLDVLTVSPRSIAGWAGVAAKVITKSDRTNSRMDRFTAAAVTITMDEPQPVHIDGEVAGSATSLHLHVQPRGLIVRTRTGSAPN